MINTVVSTRQARDNLSDLLGRVHFGDQTVTIEKKGKVYAMLISPEEYERYKELERKHFMRIVRNIHAKNAHVDPAKIERDINETVEAVRQEMYERRTTTQRSN